MARPTDIVARLLDFDRQITSTERYVMRVDAARTIIGLRAENAKLEITLGASSAPSVGSTPDAGAVGQPITTSTF